MKELNDYPMFLTPRHVAEILDMSLSHTHTMMLGEGFPLIRVGPKKGKKLVKKDDFMNWLEQSKIS